MSTLTEKSSGFLSWNMDHFRAAYWHCPTSCPRGLFACKPQNRLCMLSVRHGQCQQQAYIRDTFEGDVGGQLHTRHETPAALRPTLVPPAAKSTLAEFRPRYQRHLTEDMSSRDMN
jgi:hypothetical protein